MILFLLPLLAVGFFVLARGGPASSSASKATATGPASRPGPSSASTTRTSSGPALVPVKRASDADLALLYGRQAVSAGAQIAKAGGYTTVAGVLGVVGAGITTGLAFAQEKIADGIRGLVSTVGAAANLAPAAATLGGVPLSTAGAASAAAAVAPGGVAAGAGGTAVLASGGAGAATAAGTGATVATTTTGAVVGASIAGAAAAIGGVMAVGFAVTWILNELVGWGHTSFETRIERRNNATAVAYAKAVEGAVHNAKQAVELLRVAVAIPIAAPNRQLTIAHDTFKTDAAFTQAVERAATDRGALLDFIKGVRLSSGHTGVQTFNFALTDQYRRKLAATAGVTPAEATAAQLFLPTPKALQPAGILESLVQDYERRGVTDYQALVNRLERGDVLVPITGGPDQQLPLSRLYRSPEEYLPPARLVQDALARLRTAQAERAALEREIASQVG